MAVRATRRSIGLVRGNASAAASIHGLVPLRAHHFLNLQCTLHLPHFTFHHDLFYIHYFVPFKFFNRSFFFVIIML